MGLFDESNDQPSGSQGSNSGGGTDVLYGWLVGRAAADLGLAQALAASESQRKEQLKRLEDNLLAQVRELHSAHASLSGAAVKPAELDALKTEIERVRERQQQFSVDQINVEQLATAISVKLRDFEEQIQTQAQNTASGALGDIKLDLNLLTDRVARAEFSTQQTQASIERQPVQELVRQSMQDELARLKAELVQELANLRPAETPFYVEEERLQSKIDELRSEIRHSASSGDELTKLAGRYSRLEQTTLQAAADLKAEIGALKTRLDSPAPPDESAVKRVESALSEQIATQQEQVRAALGAIEHRDGELNALAQRLNMLSANVAALSSRADDAVARQLDQSAWVEKMETLIATHLRDGENRQSAKLAQLEKTNGGVGQLQLELNALLNRVAQLELTQQQPATQWVQEIEASLGEKIEGLREYLASERQDRIGLDAVLNGLRGEMQVVVQRLVQAEADAQQSHALLVNEAAQATQIREQIMAEVNALQAQVNQRQERDSLIEGLGADLGGQIAELQNQVSQKLAALDSRGAEIAELKGQVQHLTQLSAQKSAAPAVASRPPGPIGVNIGLGGLKPPAEAMPALTPMSPVSESSSVAPGQQTSASGPKDEGKQLQQRLSADIERARAELRKRAGVGR